MIQTLYVFAIALFLSACAEFPGVYKVDIEQGNIVTQEMVDQLAIGQTKAQVQFILGSPMLESTFTSDRWDYAYRVKHDNKMAKTSDLVVWFKNDQLAKFSVDKIVHDR